MKKLFKLFLLIYAVTHPVCTRSPESVAISQIIRDLHVKNSDRFDFIIFGLKTRKLKDLVDDVLKVTSDVSPYKLIEVKNDGTRFGVEQSAILLFDNWKAYEVFLSRVELRNESPRKFNFLVYIDDWEPMQSIQSTKQPLMLHRESFIQKSSNESIILLTYSKFQQPNCELWNREVVNKFSQAEGKWERSEFFIEKFNNFNGCELVTVLHDDGIPYTYCEYNEGRTSRYCRGSGVAVDEIIGRHFNYTSYHNPYSQNQRIFNKTVNNEHFLLAASLRWKNNLTHTHPFAVNEVFILISREAPYTQFEKLFLPFEIEVWICLIATMTTGVLTILIVKLAPRQIQDFVFGRGINTPLLNFIVISFGLGMIRLPGRNFARFLLMCFILFCLIMRTAYQAKQFEFLTKEMRRPDVKTIEDLIANNFTLYLSPGGFDLIKEMEFMTRIQKKTLSLDTHFEGQDIKAILSDGSRNAVVMTSDYYNYLYNLEKGKIDFTRLEESIIFDHVGFSFYTNSIMAEPFNRKVLQLNEAGISEKLGELFGKKHFNVTTPDDKVVLTLTHLGFGFFIWLGCLGIASTVFLLQLIYYKSLPTVASFVLRHFYP